MFLKTFLKKLNEYFTIIFSSNVVLKISPLCKNIYRKYNLKKIKKFQEIFQELTLVIRFKDRFLTTKDVVNVI